MQNYRLGDYIRSPDLKMEGRPPVVQESMLFYNALACQMIGIMHL